MRTGGRPWEASLPPVLCTVPLRPGCPLVHVCNVSDGMGVGWGELGAKRAGVLTPQKSARRRTPTPELKGPLDREPPDRVRKPFPIQ